MDDGVLLAQTIVLGLQAVALVATAVYAKRTADVARAGQQEDARIRRDELDLRRLLQLEERYTTLAQRVADFEEARREHTQGGSFERLVVEKHRLRAALDRAGFSSFPAVRKLVEAENPSAVAVEETDAALSEVGTLIAAMSAASLLPPPNDA